MRPRRILLVVPYKARDLEGHALVAHHLRARHGHEVLFTNGYGVDQKILRLAPDLLVLDHLAWDFKVRQTQLAKRLGMKVAVLSTEGLFQDYEGAARRTGKLHGAASLIDSYVVWGDYPRRAILDQQLIEPDRIHVTGCPRFDLYREPYASIRDDRETVLRRIGATDPSAPFILWATNTPYGSRSAEKIRARYSRRAKFASHEHERLIADQQTQLREHTALVAALARRHPEWNVVIKVHPAEWINPYVGLASEVPNVHLAYDAPIQDFVRHCDVLVQRNCTTATEAWMLGKPVINLEVGAYHNPVRQEYLDGTDGASSLEEAEALVAQYIAGREIPLEQQRAREAFIHDFYFRVDGHAAERCADVLHACVASRTYTDADQERTRAAAAAAHEAWCAAEDRRPMNRLKDLIGISRGTSMRFWRRTRLFRGEQLANLGKFSNEVEITADMVSGLYEKFDRVLARAPQALSA